MSLSVTLVPIVMPSVGLGRPDLMCSECDYIATWEVEGSLPDTPITLMACGQHVNTVLFHVTYGRHSAELERTLQGEGFETE